jgi:hypothetical protein
LFFLQNYYKSHNSALEKLLRRLDHSIPQWLRQDLILLQEQEQEEHEEHEDIAR